MDRIGYQMRYSTEEIWEEATKKQEEQKKNVQDQLGILQQILETTCVKKEHGSGGRPSTGPRIEADNTQLVLT
jgi:hypothetical protein